jgi:hypothetical protein
MSLSSPFSSPFCRVRIPDSRELQSCVAVNPQNTPKKTANLRACVCLLLQDEELKTIQIPTLTPRMKAPYA